VAGPPATRRDETIQYEVDRTEKRIHQPLPTLKRLSVAVVLNHRKNPDPKSKAAPAPLSGEELKQVTALVKEAVGFSEARGDSLNVVNAAFNPEPPRAAEPPPPAFWKNPDTLATAKEFGKDALLGVLVLYLLFGVLRPMIVRLSELPPPAVEEQALLASAPGAPNRLEAARQLARQDPKVVANVVKTWVAGNG
jgi:flagellar M-ring protein FliF